ncbi:MAG: DUF2304 domain-containing protein [Solirubrobacteraceae bacterium]
MSGSISLAIGASASSGHLTLQRALAIAASVGLLLLVLELVRRKHLSERYALLWLLAALVLVLLAAWKGLLTSLAGDVGIYYPPSALFAVAIGLIVVLLLHFSLAVSRLSDQNKILAQRVGLLQQRIDALEGDDPGPEHLGDDPGVQDVGDDTAVPDVGDERARSLREAARSVRETGEPVRK